MFRLSGLFLVGFLTWGLVVVRGIALERRRAVSLGACVAIEEVVGVGLGIWFARHGGFSDVAAIALGGAIAAMILLAIDKRRNGRYH